MLYQPSVPDQAFRREWELAGGFVRLALLGIRSKSGPSNVRYRRLSLGRRDRLALRGRNAQSTIRVFAGLSHG